MGRCAEQTFPNFTAECIQALFAKIRAHGVSPASSADGGTSGTASRAGFTIVWRYDPATETLTIQCTASPFFAPCSLITAQISNWVSSCYPAAPPLANEA